MATVTFFLDKRVAKDSYPLKIRITHGRGKTSLISLGVKLREDQWDGEHIVNHPKSKALNTYIEAKKYNAEGVVTRLFVNGVLDDYSCSFKDSLTL